jgi:hypothetical protein
LAVLLAVPVFAAAVFAAAVLAVDVLVLDVRAADVVERTAAPVLAVLARPVAVAVPFARVDDGVAESALVALFSVVTADSSALVAVEIAVIALLSAFADVEARAVAVVSRVAAVDTLVAAADTARGVTALAPARALVPGVALVPAVVLGPAFVAGVDLAFVRVLVVAAPLAAVVFAVLALRAGAGLVAAVLVGTDLPPIWTSYGGSHSTRRADLHLFPVRTAGSTGNQQSRALLFPLRYQPPDDPQRVRRRCPAPHRDPDQVTGQRHREPLHGVRDVPRQVEQLRPQRLRQHVLNAHPECPANLS